MTRRAVCRGVLAIIWLAASVVLNASNGEGSEPVFANALVNGSFEEGDDRQPDGWELEGIAMRRNPGAIGRWGLRLSGTDASLNAGATQVLSLPQPAPVALTVACALKPEAVQSVNDDGEGVAAVEVSFFDEGGGRIWAKTLQSWDGTAGWRRWAGLVRVPANAATLKLGLVLREAIGSVVFDDVQVMWQLPDDYDRTNLIVDGGFDYHSPWSDWELDRGQQVVFPGYGKSRGMLKISLSQPGRSIASQQVPLGGRDQMQSAALAFRLRCERVEPAHRRGGAKVELQFWDDQRQPLAPVLVLGPWAGTTADWTLVSRRIKVPRGAQEATVNLLLDEARGTVYFDTIKLTASASVRSAPMRRTLESRTDAGAWMPYAPPQGPLARSVDASDLLDAPAGRHGFLTVRDGHFAFEDGTTIRFFGVNVSGASALPTHEEAERLAERLAQIGCNIVRLHHLDAPWTKPNIFDPTFHDTQHLSADSLDRLDYFIAQLKARGIYVYLDLLVSRSFKRGDGVPRYRRLKGSVGKVAAQYSPRLIQLQKQYARDLLTHVNPYTQRRLTDEPAIALVDLINESTLFRLGAGFREALPPSYLTELRMLWHEYLAGTGAAGPAADPEGHLNGGDELTQRFYASLQGRYFEELADYLRGLGLRIPIAGSNVSNERIQAQDLPTNARLDFIDRHAYWGHPKGGFGDLVRFGNSLLLEHVEAYSPVIKLSRQRVAGRPFVVSEWNIPWPNEYRAVGPLLMAAYAAFQDWDGLIQFDYGGDLEAERITKNFDVSALPELALQFPVAAKLFRRRDVAPAQQRVAYPLRFDGEIPVPLPLLHGLDRILRGVEGPSTAPLEAEGPWISDTGELGWDQEQGLLLIETPRTQAAIGQVGQASPIALPDTTFSVATPFACLILTSLDGQPLATSERLLLTTVARSENTGTVYNATRTLLRSSGRAPILMEPVIGTLVLPKRNRGIPAVFALDAGGHRMDEVTVSASGDAVEVPLGGAHLYEIVFEAANDQTA